MQLPGYIYELLIVCQYYYLMKHLTALSIKKKDIDFR